MIAVWNISGIRFFGHHSRVPIFHFLSAFRDEIAPISLFSIADRCKYPVVWGLWYTYCPKMTDGISSS